MTMTTNDKILLHERAQPPRLRVLVDLKKHEHRHSTISQIVERTALKRSEVIEALKTLKAEGRVSKTHNPGGGIGRELWSALSNREYKTVLARRAAWQALREALSDDIYDESIDALMSTWDALTAIMAMPPEIRAKLSELVCAYHEAADAEWDESGGSRVPDEPSDASEEA